MKKLKLMMMALMMCLVTVSFAQTTFEITSKSGDKTFLLTRTKNKIFLKSDSTLSEVVFVNDQKNELILKKETVPDIIEINAIGQVQKQYKYYTLPIKNNIINILPVPHTNESQEFDFYYQKVKASKTEYLMSIITGLAGTFIYSHGVINQQPSSRNFGGALIVVGCGLTLTAYITDWSSIKHIKNLSILNSPQFK